ncbi:YchJ family protein [Streptomyces sp. CBMA29]|uniref:YchJ family protein n=1 Tax=Streptomyces sp. CBMA29 TaxID=1896314 RepID=UPI00166204C2|nr:YchJ family metal-binding protein [Streptomyces sp. CBMA29]MBD0739277.1 hypothetical protein [Streptomyces sp. CBMA29]
MPRRQNRRPAATRLSPTAPCPCGRPAAYDDCCGALHQGRAAATTAEQLMRSRYAAFAVRDAAYLLRTWHSGTRPPDLRFDGDVRWTGLDILGSTGGTAFHTEGTVEFRARFLVDGQPGDQYENSRFGREDGAWAYVDALPERTA